MCILDILFFVPAYNQFEYCIHIHILRVCLFLKNFLAKLFNTINIRVFVSSGSSSHFPSLHFFVSKKIRWKFLAKNRRLKTNALFSAYDIHHRFYSMTFSLSNKIYVCRLSRIYCIGWELCSIIIARDKQCANKYWVTLRILRIVLLNSNNIGSIKETYCWKDKWT